MIEVVNICTAAMHLWIFYGDLCWYLQLVLDTTRMIGIANQPTERKRNEEDHRTRNACRPQQPFRY